MELEWGSQRIINMYMAWRHQLIAILKKLGMKSVTELVGRFDVLAHLDYIKQEEIEGELERF
jgi:glutamate synthase domain-containing protein 2